MAFKPLHKSMFRKFKYVKSGHALSTDHARDGDEAVILLLTMQSRPTHADVPISTAVISLAMSLAARKQPCGGKQVTSYDYRRILSQHPSSEQRLKLITVRPVRYLHRQVLGPCSFSALHYSKAFHI